ncbi:hypothetical protein [Ruminococcus flavefaciens]|uniref:hypothetical protein n=1 Tax=Ruminococcus flavefaciens TaxID=1265 RepID=UPI000465FD9C|nr:hypothetical protein [Ruminococcus flavefaciens]
MANRIIYPNPYPYPTTSTSLILVTIALEVVFFILNLILLGKTESEAFRKASAKYNIPVDTVKDIWKKHK